MKNKLIQMSCFNTTGVVPCPLTCYAKHQEIRICKSKVTTQKAWIIQTQTLILIIYFFCANLIFSQDNGKLTDSTEVKSHNTETAVTSFDSAETNLPDTISLQGRAEQSDKEADTFAVKNVTIKNLSDTLTSEKNSTQSSSENKNADRQTESDEFESDKVLFDIILDISRGMNMTKFMVQKPGYISTETKANFLFDIGIMIPFKKYFYASVYFRYFKLKFTLSESLAWSDGQIIMNTSTATEETMSFISAPVKCGMRFELGKVSPYFYADIEPAYLTACSQFIVSNTSAIFPDGAHMKIRNDSKDIETTKYRERHQIFAGGGTGIEVFYGYGVVYLDAGFQVALKETDEPNDLYSRPIRTSTKLIYFPISLGIRFFL